MAKQRGLGTFSLTSILTPQETASTSTPVEPEATETPKLDATTPASPDRQDTPKTPDSPATPVLPQRPSTPAPRDAEGGGTVRDTVYMPAQLERRLANAVYWARMTKNAIFLEGVERVLADLEAANGGPFDDIPPQTILKHARTGRRRS